MVVDNNPIAATIVCNRKNEALKYADLGSAVIANFSMTNRADNVNPTENTFGAYRLIDCNFALYNNCLKQKGGMYFTFELLSSLFGGPAKKKLPMSAIHGLRIILFCERINGCFVQFLCKFRK